MPTTIRHPGTGQRHSLAMGEAAASRICASRLRALGLRSPARAESSCGFGDSPILGARTIINVGGDVDGLGRGGVWGGPRRGGLPRLEFESAIVHVPFQTGCQAYVGGDRAGGNRKRTHKAEVHEAHVTTKPKQPATPSHPVDPQEIAALKEALKAARIAISGSEISGG